MKNVIIAVLTAIIYRNVCITINNNTFAIIFGAVCMAGCVYFFMRELDARNERKRRY